MMAEGLEVIIKYRGAKYNRVASPATASSEFAILKKDLAHLRVHSPSQKNVRRVNGSFILHWPAAGTSPKLDGLADSLHTRWFKLCSDDPEALKLREFLSIIVDSHIARESITLTQDGVLIRSTVQRDQVQDVPPGTLRMGDSSSGVPQQPAQVSVPAFLPAKPPPPLLPPPRVPPSAPRLDRLLPPRPKRRMSSIGASSNSPTRQKLDMPETHRMSPDLRTINTQAQPTRIPTSPKTDLPQHRSTTPREPPPKPAPQPLREDDAPKRPPSRDSGEMTPLTPLPVTTPISAPPTSAPGWGPLDRDSELRPPSPAGPAPAGTLSTAPAPIPASGLSITPAPASTSPNPSSASSGAGDVARLMRELLETRNQLATMEIREQAILDDLERLGAPPVESYRSQTGGGSGADGGKDDRSGAESALRDEVSRLENELRLERASRMRAESTLSEVERECRAPFVVPALFQAFMKISELSN